VAFAKRFVDVSEVRFSARLFALVTRKQSIDLDICQFAYIALAQTYHQLLMLGRSFS
jgi:hypothetical protein